jgi:hypothetical protein
MAVTRKSALMACMTLTFCLPGASGAAPSAEEVVANYMLAMGGSKAIASNHRSRGL